MTTVSTSRIGVTALLLALAVALGGCSRGVAWMDRRDQEQPLVQRASARAAEGDIDSAIRLYSKALEQDPTTARAHLDLAFLLQDHRKDYIGAIYHYRQYLEMRPGTEKQDMVEQRMRMAEQRFATDILGPSRLADKAAALEHDNATLRAQLADLSRRLAARLQQPETAPRVSAPVVASAQPTSPIGTAKIPGRGQAMTYRVKRGDSLISIAGEVYGDSARWKQIQTANSDILGNSNQVKAGQVLVIP